MDVGICVRVSEYRYKIYPTGMWLAFWEWEDQFGYIPHFYRFLFELYKSFSPLIIIGGKINARQHKALYEDGLLHPLSITKRGFSYSRNWSRDILDIHHKHHSPLLYGFWYGWKFPKVQREFRRYADRFTDLSTEDFQHR